jgi:hypothetical protein
MKKKKEINRNCNIIDIQTNIIPLLFDYVGEVSDQNTHTLDHG